MSSVSSINGVRKVLTEYDEIMKYEIDNLRRHVGRLSVDYEGSAEDVDHEVTDSAVKSNAVSNLISTGDIFIDSLMFMEDLKKK